ncbi:MAG: MFS transporter [Bryobacteraceae bacterium]|jgi:ACS family hexuronate transporter-like MFS transporter
MLFLATVINYLDRQALSILAPELRDRFHMTNVDYSRILFAFLLAYLIMQGVSGRLMDKLGTRRGFSLTIAWWSAAAMLHAVATSARSFGVCRFLLGMGEAGNWPGGVKVVSEWFPARERAFAIGLFNSGSTLGAVIAPPLVVSIVSLWGWQAAFLMTGAIGFAWLALWLATVRPPLHPPEDGPPAPAVQRRWLDLLRYREVWALVGGRLLADPVWWFYVFWLPEYLRRARHFTLAEIGYFAWIPFLTAGVGCLAGGMASGWLIRRGWRVLPARKIVMAVSALAMLSGIPAVLAAEAWVALAWISAVTLFYQMWSANILTLAADLFPQHEVASVSGLSGAGAALGGMCFNLLVGLIVDRFSYVPVFLLAGVMPLVAASFIFAGIRERRMERSPA